MCSMIKLQLLSEYKITICVDDIHRKKKYIYIYIYIELHYMIGNRFKTCVNFFHNSCRVYEVCNEPQGVGSSGKSLGLCGSSMRSKV